MGCYRSPKADVDMLAISARGLTPTERRRLAEKLIVAHDARRSGAGIEISVVTAEAARAGSHPMPFEVHVCGDCDSLPSMREGTFDYGARRTDHDLAAHITVARARGLALFGPPAAEAFAPVPWRHYLEALETDLQWALERLAENPAYFVLNACRVLQIDALGEGTVMSKAEGARWGRENLPPQYHSLIGEALRHYLSDEPEGMHEFDPDTLQRFAAFVRCRKKTAGTAKPPRASASPTRSSRRNPTRRR
jgi:streptomycin 3"-adenylyltransferase